MTTALLPGRGPGACAQARWLALVLALPLLAGGEELSPPAPADVRFFEEKIQPLLEQRCYECHSHQSGKMKNGLALDSRSGWVTGGDSGPAVVPGDLEKSLFIKAIRHTDPDLKMPPKKKLAEEMCIRDRCSCGRIVRIV